MGSNWLKSGDVKYCLFNSLGGEDMSLSNPSLIDDVIPTAYIRMLLLLVVVASGRVFSGLIVGIPSVMMIMMFVASDLPP